MADSDTIWIEFLSSLYDDTRYREEDNEEEVNDPEYSISEDLKQLYDEWDFRNDKAVKVSDQELDLLFEEDNEVEVQTIETAIVANNQTIDSNVFNKESVQILVHQITEHIQLLTQTYFQSINSNSLEDVTQNAKSMLNEMNDYSNLKTNSIFATINLKPSIKLISDYPTEKCVKTCKSLTSWRSLPVTRENQKIFISNPNVFVYTWLLPSCGYYDKQIDNKNKSKTVFTLSEDHLIALGLEQFTPLFSLRKCYKYIKQLLLPIKTVEQIRTHIKNIKRRSKNFSENPIIFYNLNNRAPEIHSGIIDPKLDTYLSSKNIPEWYKKAIIKSQTIQKEITQENIESNNALSYSQSKSKKFKSANVSQNDKKKVFISQQSSPAKQTNYIVKKYRYLNRINPLKQTLTIMSNMNSRSNKSLTNSPVTSSVIEVIDLSEDSKEKSIASETIGEVSDAKDNFDVRNCSLKENVNFKNKIRVCNKNNDINEINMNEDESEKPLNENINEDDVEFDDESDLAALMTASSTITIKNKIKSKNNNEMTNSSLLTLSNNKKEGRKSLAVKQRESTLQLLSLEWNESDPNSQHKEELLVHYYLEKVRKSLSHESFVHFLTLLSEFERNKNSEPTRLCSIKELYYQMEQFLSQSNVSKDIISEFVLFLSAEQAEECGKMFDYLYWKRFFNFIRKLEIYSSVDPQCLHRLLRSLNQLNQNEDLDKNKIRSTVSRVLNGHMYLMHEFSSLFLDEKPSQYLFEDEDFDEIVVESSDEEEKNDSLDKICFENIKIPENDDEVKYGTNECPCKTCHIPTINSQPLGRHCTSCSIRFIGGRVYLTQSHKKLHLAEIHYHDSDSQSNKLLLNNEINKQIEDEEETNVESDHDMDIESIQLTDKSVENVLEKRKWTISQDKMLLELCRSKVIEEKRNDLSEEIFEEAALKLSRDTNEVIARFNQLMELFAAEQETGRENEEIEV